MRLVDSHCHLDFPDLAERVPELLAAMRDAEVIGAVCIGVRLEEFPQVLALAEANPCLLASVGVHPDSQDCQEPTEDQLVRLAEHPKIVGIGETGLDYYRLTGDLEWQRKRFRTHIRAAHRARKPLIVHTRAAAADTLAVMREERAGDAGGVMHCFTESWDVAREALDLGFHLSFSGIVSFKTAEAIREVAQRAPLDRILVETDSPYLAPMPYRGKTNQPAWVRHVAAAVAKARGMNPEALAEATTANFLRLFPAAVPFLEGGA